MPRLPGRRLVPWFVVFEVLRAGKAHWDELDPRDRTRLVELMRKSKGRASNLGERERTELRDDRPPPPARALRPQRRDGGLHGPPAQPRARLTLLRRRGLDVARRLAVVAREDPGAVDDDPPPAQARPRRTPRPRGRSSCAASGTWATSKTSGFGGSTSPRGWPSISIARAAVAGLQRDAQLAAGAASRRAGRAAVRRQRRRHDRSRARVRGSARRRRACSPRTPAASRPPRRRPRSAPRAPRRPRRGR